MNEITLTGRISSDITLKTTKKGDNETNHAIFNFAVPDRNAKKDDEGNYPCDFFRCVAFGALSELLNNYTTKGSKLLIKGKLKNNNYEKDGQKVYSNEIVVSEVEFLDLKKKDGDANSGGDYGPSSSSNNGRK
jgi:single-strand DNA-binding protein